MTTSPDTEPRWTLDEPDEADEAPHGTFDDCGGYEPDDEAMDGVDLPDVDVEELPPELADKVAEAGDDEIEIDRG